MKTYTVGTKLFCDFAFSGKPNAVCVEVIEPGHGRFGGGRIKVRITKDQGAYHKGEVLELGAAMAVPCAQELKLSPGQFFRRVSTEYQWVKP